MEVNITEGDTPLSQDHNLRSALPINFPTAANEHIREQPIANKDTTNMSTTTTTIAIPTPPPSRPRPSHHRRSKSSHTAHDFWKHFQERPLDAIFRPKSVALVGASEREGSVGRTLMWNLLSRCACMCDARACSYRFDCVESLELNEFDLT